MERYIVKQLKKVQLISNHKPHPTLTEPNRYKTLYITFTWLYISKMIVSFSWYAQSIQKIEVKIKTTTISVRHQPKQNIPKK